MGNILIERDTMVDIADSIRGKTGSVELMKPDEMPGAIDSIPTGGGGSAADPELPVRFFSYDGDLLYSYTLEEVAELEALPPVPEVQGLVSQGWNWTLAELVENGRQADVGPMYITDDGATRVYIKLNEGRLSPVLGFIQNKAYGVTVDWGDGSVEKSNSTRNYLSNMTHVYANAGKYMISMLPDPDTTMSLIPDTNSGGTCITPYSRHSDHYENVGYTYTVEKVEIGRNVVLGKRSFACCAHMRSISIPAYIQSIGEYGFEQCYQLKMLVLPRGAVTINEYLLSYCRSFETISIPYTVTTVEKCVFMYCCSIRRIALPKKVSSIGRSAFTDCSSLGSFRFPDAVTIVPNNCFSSASGLMKVDYGNATIENIEGYAYYNCCAQSIVEIPASVLRIGMNAYKFVKSKVLYAYPETPPELADTSVFEELSSDLVIYVPNGCLSAYQAAPIWSTLASRMVEMPE